MSRHAVLRAHAASAAILAIVAWVGATIAAVPAKKSAAPKGAAAPRVTSSTTVRPNFSGHWKLDTTRTTFGKTPGRPLARTDVIAHQEPSLSQTLFLVRESGNDTTIYHYLTDSTESVNRVDTQEIKTRVWWEGTALRLDSRTRILVFDAKLKDRWSLSVDGKTLTMQRRSTSPLGEDEQTLVFAKQ